MSISFAKFLSECNATSRINDRRLRVECLCICAPKDSLFPVPSVFDDVPRANQRSLTQDLIANLLEVRGEGVTKNAGKLQDAGSVRYCVKRWARLLGLVHTISASANGWHRVPIEALDEVQTGRLHEERNEE